MLLLWDGESQWRIYSGENMQSYSADKWFPQCVFSGKAVCVCASNQIHCMGELPAENVSANQALLFLDCV